MGDMGDDFRLLRLHNADRKAANMKANLGYLNSINADYEVYNHGYQLNFKMNKEIVAFYPSTNKWVLNNKIFFGTAKHFINWMKKKEDK